ncbi:MULTISPECIES: 2-hydroxyacid dehydrogenase [Cupriavidus]
MILLIKSGGAQALPEWREAFAGVLPEAEVRLWGDPAVPAAAVRYALVWEPERGALARYPNLRLAISAGAGIEHMLADDLLPPGLPLARLVLPETRQGMAEFVAMGTLMLMRGMHGSARDQQQRRWRAPPPTPLAQRTRVGVMGLGALGLHAARYLAGMGFRVQGWSRSAKTLDGVATCHGMAQLPDFLARSDILVNLLPQTADTAGLLNRERLAMLPHGARLLNAGRAAHVVQQDLLDALDSGRLDGALLDVFDSEPLPAVSPLWDHPKVIVTPHCAATPSRWDRARRAAELIRMAEGGGEVEDVYEVGRGY